MGNRYYGLDHAKGIAVLGMILSHSFMGTLAQWNSKILFSLVEKIPTVLMVVLLVPIALFSQMGSLFSFISAICVTMSFLGICRKGWPVVWRYLLMKMIYAVLLRLIEVFWKRFTVDFDMFETRKLQWPVASLPFSGDTLDCIGFIGWTIPLLLYLLSLAPFLGDYRIQIGVVYVLSLIVSFASRSLSQTAETVEKWCHENSLFFTEYLASKASSGPFQTFQVWPFGLLGCCVGILLNAKVGFRKTLVFAFIVLAVNGISGTFMLLKVDDFITELFENFKPEGFMMISMIVQLFIVIWLIYLVDRPRRSLKKRRASLARTTFLRRMNTLSLTAYVLEPFLAKKVFAIFQVLFGKAVDHDAKVCLWDWPVVGLYALTDTMCAIGIARVWESCGFRFSIEHQLGAIMHWIWGNHYTKLDYKENIYGPVQAIDKEISEHKDSV